MDTKSTNQAEEDFQPESENLTGKERTRKFIKKLEIQHKLLQKMIDPDPGMQQNDLTTEQ